MKNLHPGLLFLSFVAGVTILTASSVFTFYFFSSLTPGPLGVLLGVLGVCNDVGKVVFLPAVVLCVMSNRRGTAFFFCVLWIGCFLISLVASQSFDLNKKAEIKNEAVTNSDSYKRQNTLFSTTSESIAELKKGIASLRSSREQEIKNASAHFKSQIAYAKKMDYITTERIGVNAITEKMRKAEESTRTRIDKEIAEKEKQLRLKEVGLSSIDKAFDGVTMKIDTTEGLIGFSVWLSSVTGQDSDKIVGWFYIFKNVFSEFLGLGLIMLSGMELKPIFPTGKPKGQGQSFLDKLKDIISSKEPKTVTVTNKEQIPELADETPVEPCIQAFEEIREYVREYAKQALSSIGPDKSCWGLTKMARHVPMDENEEPIFSRNDLLKGKIYLEETAKVLKTQGNTTYVINAEGLQKYL